MTIRDVLLPLFVEVILTFVIWSWMAVLRARDFESGAVRPDNVALREPNWPKRTMQLGNAFSNQFELPVLFYVLTILEYVTHLAGIVFVALTVLALVTAAGFMRMMLGAWVNAVLVQGAALLIGLALLFPALLLLILGGGLFKTNTTAQVGMLYEEGDARRDRAYSIFYVGVNLGAFIAPLIAGTLGE